MTALEKQIESFHQYASECARHDSGLTFDEIYGRWRHENLPEDDLAESLASLGRGLRDYREDRVRPFEEVVNNLRSQLNES